MNLKFNRYLAGAALLAASGAASASPCDVVLSGYSNAVISGLTSSASWYLSNHPECFGGGSTTSQVQINSTSFQQATAISTALASRFLASSPGPQASMGSKSMAAGGKVAPWNVWGNLSSNDTRQSYLAQNTGITKNDNDILTTVLGADYVLSPVMAAGVSAAFDRGDGTGTNSVSTSGPNSITSKGYTIAPYFGMQISKALALDASVGFGKSDLGMTGGVTTEADRWFAAANLSYAQWMDKIQLTGKLSYLHGEEDYDNSKVSGVAYAGTSARNKLDQLRGGLQVGYWMNGFMPYAGLAYHSDTSRSTTQFGASNDPIGKDAWVWTLGANLFSLKSGVTGGIAYNQEENRSNQKYNNLVANINIRF
jgi:hypothetical protein